MCLCTVTSGLMTIYGGHLGRSDSVLILYSLVLYMRPGKDTSTGVSPSCWAISYNSCSADRAVTPMAA